MRPVAIHQFVPVLAAKDAVGSHALMVQRVLRDMGFQSEIYVAEADAALAARAHPFRSFRVHRGATDRTWLLYQCATGNLMGDFVASRPEPKLLSYHNLTPAALLEGWDPVAAHAVTVGRYQVARLARGVELAIAMSRLSEDDLTKLGCRRTVVVPPLLDRCGLEQEPDPVVVARLQDRREQGGADLLFVGRISPSKAQHDLVKALAAYQRVYDSRARLHLVGGASSPRYRRALEQLISHLGLDRSVNLAGPVTQAALTAYYQTADVFVSCSDHEGFGIPLVEAMHHRVPIVAYDSGAVSETVRDAGVVLPGKSAALVAAAVHRVASDAAVRKALTVAAEARLEQLSPERNRARFVSAIEGAVEESHR